MFKEPNSITNLPDELIQDTRDESETRFDSEKEESETENDDEVEEEDDDEDKPISLKLFFKSVLKVLHPFNKFTLNKLINLALYLDAKRAAKITDMSNVRVVVFFLYHFVLY